MKTKASLLKRIYALHKAEWVQSNEVRLDGIFFLQFEHSKQISVTGAVISLRR